MRGARAAGLGGIAVAVAVAVGAASPALVDVRATLAGTVLADRLVAVGDRVEDGQPLVYVRTPLTGTVAVAARAPQDGIVRDVLVEPGQRIERGQVVVRLEPR
ncbi:MAG: acetyl-CoA carboxylase biotin carboxyl carrier protein subunit [Armatimonadota bacterium]|nr:acetyl-CoA carboxylase biotin carboxyl carrier protein subunit [Armatimonadota bacterium]MDR7401497.1 acetyl-CoA carboxylase biotin carboxyl carrier protein subunit [Armatimonadota bacterium]MDR7404573.1 acetyl-CoA carboxylase biotin carboxyl carrier protein subunit [Armatimonadota bacterium]MDR7437536.1 acetyl-CoA carboxylase biotin carboxyl carrier protein subunit [Armatimonadota bacterium]MDR7471695.1 acetyl-CoA carboxylase biotin carboxyl carrier protein subunit [Armatimonadota bacterium